MCNLTLQEKITIVSSILRRMDCDVGTIYAELRKPFYKTNNIEFEELKGSKYLLTNREIAKILTILIKRGSIKPNGKGCLKTYRWKK